MTLTLELTPQEERRLEAARAKGIDVLTMLKGFIASLPDAPKIEQDQTSELFAQWDREDAEMTPSEIAAAQAEWEETKDSLNAARALSGEEPLF